MKQKFGPTGKFPQGILGPSDEGEIQIGVAHDSRGTIIINFGTRVSWLGLPPEQAINLARTILRHAGVKKVEIEF
jgi:hypothetical protein